MAIKSANVTARIQPEVKEQAEAVLEKVGVPYSLTIPMIPTLDGMSAEQFNVMMQRGYGDAKAGRGLSVEDAFQKIREEI